jgi:hypothetical protein
MNQPDARLVVRVQGTAGKDAGGPVHCRWYRMMADAQ